MVAITVILAAVIGAFVLEIGDQQETAPSTSFDSQQQMKHYSGAYLNINVTEVSYAHAGGDVVDIQSTDIVLEGNDSVWGIGQKGRSIANVYEYRPVPDITETLGMNQQASFSSGESWTFMMYAAPPGADNWYLNNDAGVPLYGDATVNNPGSGVFRSYGNHQGSPPEFIEIQPDAGASQGVSPAVGVPLESDDQANIVWTASSGGKTQTLFKYTVQ
jgi:hypothetical protein